MGRLGLRVLAVATLCGLIIAACGTPDPNEVCDGVQRSLGGCDGNQPTYAGTTCDEVGREFGIQLDSRIVDALEGQDVVDGLAKSARVTNAEYLLVARANQHLRRSGLIADCSATTFFEAAEREFSDELKSELGPVLSEFQDHEVTYEEWRAGLLDKLSVIDEDEDEPA
jgi:hypothetical protein